MLGPRMAGFLLVNPRSGDDRPTSDELVTAAHDLGLDRDDPIGALAAFRGAERRIDVGRAGDRLFLNNVSLGVYARLVHRRERHRRRREVLARLRALAILVTHREPLGISVDGERVETRLLLVANNAYALELP